jgi:hypothetical protein
MSVPFLPGFVNNKPVARPLPQKFNAVGGVVFEKRDLNEPEVDYTKAVADRALKARTMTTKEKSDLAATKRTTATTTVKLPERVIYDRQVWTRMTLARVFSV